MAIKKNILLIYYSQTGQLESMATSLIEPLKSDDQIDVEILQLVPNQAFDFPWSFTDFFNIFPETVHLKPREINAPTFKKDHYDLIILAYSVWFLSPSQPITAFLKHANSQTILKNTPVVTCIGCRNMWLMAQERVKEMLRASGAYLVDNIVKTDQCSGPASFIGTPLWMFTGKKQVVKWLPKAGVSDEDIAMCSQFGEQIKKTLHETEANTKIKTSMLKNMGAVHVNERLILSEKFAYRSFYLWGKLIMHLGQYSQVLRRSMIYFYVAFLVVIILTVLPVSAVIKKIMSPLMRKKIKLQKEYFSAPSGE